jgi:hypothetical protein
MYSIFCGLVESQDLIIALSSAGLFGWFAVCRLFALRRSKDPTAQVLAAFAYSYQSHLPIQTSSSRPSSENTNERTHQRVLLSLSCARYDVQPCLAFLHHPDDDNDDDDDETAAPFRGPPPGVSRHRTGSIGAAVHDALGNPVGGTRDELSDRRPHDASLQPPDAGADWHARDAGPHECADGATHEWTNRATHGRTNDGADVRTNVRTIIPSNVRTNLLSNSGSGGQYHRSDR